MYCCVFTVISDMYGGTSRCTVGVFTVTVLRVVKMYLCVFAALDQ